MNDSFVESRHRRGAPWLGGAALLLLAISLQLLVLGAPGGLPAGARAAEPPADPAPRGTGPGVAAELPVRWDVEALSTPPAVHPAPGFEAAGVRALYYDGLPWKGKPTRVFAWYGAPGVGEGERLPAMVLVHGGGGTAFEEWVRLWTGRGYAAIAMDLCGSTPGGSHGERPRHAHGGPPGWGGFDQIEEAIEDQWAYHAVADIVLAHSLIRSFPEVDPERIGMTGISWGGYLTSIAAAVDSRFRLAVPVYGCGFLGENSCWLPTFESMGPQKARKWLGLWDPSGYLPHASMPFLWVSGTNDFAYPLDSLQKSYRLPPGERTLAIRVRMPHAHGGPGEKPEEIHAFANCLLKGQPPLARVTAAGIQGNSAWAAYESRTRVVRAELHLTRDAGEWKSREWETVPATLHPELSMAEAPVPPEARVLFLSLLDERGLLVSAEHLELDPPAATPGDGAPLSAAELRRLLDALEAWHPRYDPVERMLRQPFSSPGYHTTLKGGDVHRTRESLKYAVALLDTGDPALLARAVEILRRVVALQDKDPESRTYGIWSWFLEEPLDRMSPPDWNWADFCGTQLLQAAIDHRRRLPEDLAREIDEAITHAARSIQRRNVGPGYTNIAIMGTYVTLVAAETYGIADLEEYALGRLDRFCEYTSHHGGFTEYNSPTYTVVALEELARMLRHVRNPAALKKIQEIYRIAWTEVARHFHPPTRQWAGPHSRSYRTLLADGTLSLIGRATGGRVDLGADAGSIDEHRLGLSCPEDLHPLFQRIDEPRELETVFYRGPPPVVGTTYLEPAFALGSVNRGDLWNQRRPLVAYWGTAARPSYLRLRFLHDGYDFAAAQFFGRQRRGDILAGINLATDGGDTHVSLDRIRDATFRARDLRVRFELGGEAGGAEPRAPAELSEGFLLELGGLHISLAVPFALFGEHRGRWEAGREGGTSWLDVVLYCGDERAWNLAEVDRAAVGLAVRLSSGGEGRPDALAEESDGRLSLRWGSLELGLPVKPARAAELQRSATP